MSQTNNKNKIIVFDTETTGFNPTTSEIVQLSYILYDLENQNIIYATNPGDDFVNIDGLIPEETSDVHGITKDMTLDKRPIKDHIDEFIHYCDQAEIYVGHNIKFDIGMIVGQIKKIMKKSSDQKYTEFLQRFQMVGKNLPENAYCTMASSKEVCARIRGTPNKQKNDKLMEVHRLLFKQIVAGQLHNALVDISVTLRVYIYLTLGIDICQTMTTSEVPGRGNRVFGVKNNNDICNLIRPVHDISTSPLTSMIPYDGELISSLSVLPNNELEEKNIIVTTMAKQMVSQFIDTAVQKVAPEPPPFTSDTMCTAVTICTAILESGQRKGKMCARTRVSNGEFCSYHPPKTMRNKKRVAPEPSGEEEQIDAPVSKKPAPAIGFLSSIGVRKNNIVPVGGLRKKHTNRKTQKRGGKNRQRRRATKKCNM